MTRKSIALAVLGAFCIGGCASLPKPVIPDGADRSPINSTAVITNYEARTAEENTNYNERTILGRQVEGLTHQVADLRASVASLQEQVAAMHPGAKGAKPTAGPAGAPAGLGGRLIMAVGAAPVAPMSWIAPPPGAVEVRDQSVIFRVTHPFAKTDFEPTAQMGEEILKAARAAEHIEVRGRTDGTSENLVDERIAIARAAHAKAFLVAKGIEPSKIRISAMATGGHIVENDSEAGRAANRRVEIETMDMDTTPFSNAALPRSQLQATLGSDK